jgi:23S rRNA pseudouridine1911/1915/1917 synthase
MKEDTLQKNKRADITVLYEDADILVINKPVGYLVHADGRTDSPTVVEWFLARAPEARGVGEPGLSQDGTPLERSGVVHRLDRDTSGVLVLAKHQGAFLHLKAQFHDRLVRKEYRAIVHGTMKEEWGTITRPIGRSTKDFRLRSAEKGARGVLRDATTEWKLLSQSTSHAYLALFPKTGRTHQLRVHLKSISRPIVGDVLYTTPLLKDADTLGFTRLALHAHRITMVIPNGKTETFEAPLPPDFAVAMSAIASADAVC